VIEHAPIGMALLSLDGRYRQVNRAYCSLLGRDEAALLASSLGAVMHRDDVLLHLDLLSRTIEGDLPGFRLESRYLRPDGSTVWADVSVAVVDEEGGRRGSCIVQVLDITERKLAEERLRHDARHDALTGLRNRAGLDAAIDEALEATRLTGSRTAVLFLDLDRFKPVNDEHGHAVGDQVLRAVAGRLQRCVRPGDSVARLGGDEFVIVARGVANARAVSTLAARVQRVVGQPIRVQGRSIQIDVSIGTHLIADDETADAALRSADRAMYQVKRERTRDGAPPAMLIDLDADVRVTRQTTEVHGPARSDR
jgi:diguanylate cyclase (GGDEF)-like protein/PAS domain S-box-containing protein